MPGSESTSTSVMDDLTAAYRHSLAVASDIRGDIPSLLRHAYSRHFNKVLPVENDAETTSASASSAELESLQTMLSRIPPLKPTAQALLDRARSILADGPPLSMNVELAEGQELPVALHTLLQGTLFAVLVHGGADPDLERTVEQAEKQGVGYSQEDKLLWFLCKKFAFVHQVAAKDGQTATDLNNSIAHRMYAGRVFELMPGHQIPKYAMVRVPPVAHAFGLGTPLVLLSTGTGLYGLDRGDSGITFNERSKSSAHPARVAFCHCPAVAELEESLPAWRKHELVIDAAFAFRTCFLLTPVGVAAGGKGNQYYVGPDVPFDDNALHPVPLPEGFTPDSIVAHSEACVVSMGAKQMIAGVNAGGQLGLGHSQTGRTFVDLPFRVDRILQADDEFSLFLSGDQVLFAGDIGEHIIEAGLLPDFEDGDTCETATPLQFATDLKRIFCDLDDLICVHEGQTLWTTVHPDTMPTWELPVEATAASVDHHRTHIYLQDDAGRWFEFDQADEERGLVPVEPHDVRGELRELVEVDVAGEE
ncbi:hypothetical protein J8273_5118 [Carpediemonas membranifera]|uniref:Uncharacterized protein n=1 Tax=Carpediemonas membranifera TaxID=201153 RepID=A0A8J6DYF3_9EUKA|nr:hypothetical protein J8273_5118 [Carpediemonas membranifera]|eukprot:KAG9392139.1 hypothetical protein J8273_5118 [Carpediemonas membranifera]